MTDNKPDTPAAKPADNGTPPWGDDFNAETAWTLIQNLRGELKTVKTERTTFKNERDALSQKVEEHENAGKSAEELKAAAEKKAADDLAAARRELWIERALRKHGVPEELVEFLSGDDEEAILAKAEKLAGLGQKSDKSDADDAADKGGDASGDAGTPQKNSRPASGLTPGHGGDDPEPLDLDALVLASR
ncbi:scaffolding protein [Microbacterium phage Cen1621]|uniref:Scaffolding protein n=1 Tax=Microbacterium phage Cen1621 TaxID=2965191 RepID=A0A9E7QAG5_9CAUD|nr:scaffolding protein [Microbacterium phage Cen1621]